LDSGWSVVPTTSTSVPHPRAHHPLVYSEESDSLFTYGGYRDDPSGNGGTFVAGNYLDDLWRFDLNTKTWHQYTFSTTAGTYPGIRDNAKLIPDDDNNRIWLYGGATYDGTVYNDLWYFDLIQNTWTKVTIDSPPPRTGQYYFTKETKHTLEFYMFGGATGEFAPVLLTDMWKLTIQK